MERQLYHTLVSHIRVDQSATPHASKPALTHLILFPLAHIVRQPGLRCACGDGGGRGRPCQGKWDRCAFYGRGLRRFFSSSQIKQMRSIRCGVTVAHVNLPGWAQKQTGSALLRHFNRSYDRRSRVGVVGGTLN